MECHTEFQPSIWSFAAKNKTTYPVGDLTALWIKISFFFVHKHPINRWRSISFQRWILGILTSTCHIRIHHWPRGPPRLDQRIQSQGLFSQIPGRWQLGKLCRSPKNGSDTTGVVYTKFLGTKPYHFLLRQRWKDCSTVDFQKFSRTSQRTWNCQGGSWGVELKKSKNIWWSWTWIISPQKVGSKLNKLSNYQESFNTPLEHTPGNPPTQLWKDSLYNLLVKV